MDDKLEQFTEKLITLGDRLVEAAEPGAQMALDATLTGIWLDGVFSIGIGCALVVLSAASGFAIYKFALKNRGLEDDIFFFGSIPLVVAAIFFAVGGFIQLTQTKHFIAVASPEAALALRIVGG
ncbi:hypothetical protein [Roseibium sp.]|uniref:hypothetical protein n=1 Tax=Roseibium sp. TaxID=1936156 RepID=UPI003B51696B